MPATRSTSRKESRGRSSPAKRKQATAASGGGLGTGLLLLIGGLVLHGHYAPIKSICDSGLGALGQALEPSAQSHCSLDSALAEAGTVAMVIGGVILAGVLLTVVGLFFEARLVAEKPAASEQELVAVSKPARTQTAAIKPAGPKPQPVGIDHPKPSKYKFLGSGHSLTATAIDQVQHEVNAGLGLPPKSD
ncbi:MAG TPA: hypothetical protein VG125_28520 [Pirellulales bacterium]|jgi:hypothetical protein|nr:hypothetical protein [Pirellulales bacterium]